jgi:hypothetical protein
LANPLAFPAIAGGVAADKFDALKARRAPNRPETAALRYLLPARVVQK